MAKKAVKTCARTAHPRSSVCGNLQTDGRHLVSERETAVRDLQEATTVAENNRSTVLRCNDAINSLLVLCNGLMDSEENERNAAITSATNKVHKALERVY